MTEQAMSEWVVVTDAAERTWWATDRDHAEQQHQLAYPQEEEEVVAIFPRGSMTDEERALVGALMRTGPAVPGRSMTSHELARLLLGLPDQPEVLCEEAGFVIGAHVSSYADRLEQRDVPCAELEIY